MDDSLFKQLHDSISKIVGDSKKQQQQPPQQPPEAGAGGGGGATAGGDIDRGYLHQCTLLVACDLRGECAGFPSGEVFVLVGFGSYVSGRVTLWSSLPPLPSSKTFLQSRNLLSGLPPLLSA